MCQAGFLYDRNPWRFHRYGSHWSYCLCAPTSCLAGEVWVGKKSMCLAAVSGVAVAAAKLLLARWESW